MAGKQLIDADFASTRSARAIALLWLLIVAGCSGIQPAVEVESATPDAADAATQPPPTPAVDTPDTSNATLALLQQSQRAATSGATNEAISYLERAIRIEPRRADLWLQLAALEVTNQQHPCSQEPAVDIARRYFFGIANCSNRLELRNK